MMQTEIRVGISDYKLGKAPDKLITVGLGSCIGTIIYDEKTKFGGLSHIMLPDSTMFAGKQEVKVAKFADLALPQMVSEIKKQVPFPRLKAKMVGGASMFGFNSSAASIGIGQRNIEAVEKILKELRIPIVAKHVGGNAGRTMIVDLNDFKTTVRIVNQEIVYI
ncbi:chemotaxis protein CheD [Enterococcus saccharolyticus]|uniref:chemotaxis protein CheD n=1 Tax=Enterococcus saccharolyticus TaxID=41997 RepID=UPI0039E06CEA